MAPRGSHGSSGSGGGSGGSSAPSCDYCTAPLYLTGYNWKNSKVDGWFALECITVVVLLVCLGLATQFKWTKQNGARDTPRSAGYLTATICTIIYLIFSLVDTGLTESNTETTNLYYLTYIFRSLFYRISEVLILAVILRMIVESTSSRTLHKFSGVNLAAIILVTLLSISALGISIAQDVFILLDGRFATYDHASLQKSGYQVAIAYESLYLVTVIFGAVIGFIVLIKERSMATLLMSVFVIPALFLRILFDLAWDAAYFAAISSAKTTYPKALLGLNWADNYIYVLATMAIFLGVAIIGCLRPKVSNAIYDPQPQQIGGYNGVQVPVYNQRFATELKG